MNAATLWDAYRKEKDPTARDRLLSHHLRLVHHIARQMARGLRLDAELDDLVSAGTIGLVKAIENYDPTRGIAFSTFAAVRIRGAILDELQERDGQTLFELCSRLAMKHGVALTRQAISQHLAVLESAGLVRTERQGRYKFHYIDTAPLQAIAERWPARRREGGGP